jgi:tRNA threonylcarbamoyl adenosine modification protein YeaZ
MKILALEFSTAQLSVAVIQSEPGANKAEVSEVIEAGARSPRALVLVEEALHQAQVEREQIECLAVGLGPGSYSGIRSAIAVAQGWQIAREVATVGITSVECVAAQAQAEGIHGRIHVLIDAQRNEFYLATYEIGSEDRQEIQPLQLATFAEAQARPENGGMVIGPEANKWFPSARVVFPRAAMLGKLALARKDFVPAEKLDPLYLRETSFVKAPPARHWPTANS